MTHFTCRAKALSLAGQCIELQVQPDSDVFHHARNALTLVLTAHSESNKETKSFKLATVDFLACAIRRLAVLVFVRRDAAGCTSDIQKMDVSALLEDHLSPSQVATLHAVALHQLHLIPSYTVIFWACSSLAPSLFSLISHLSASAGSDMLEAAPVLIALKKILMTLPPDFFDVENILRVMHQCQAGSVADGQEVTPRDQAAQADLKRAFTGTYIL